MYLDLRNEIEHHCNQCPNQDTDMCNFCFFASVDFRRLDLGNKFVYSRAFRYLKKSRIIGFRRNDTFGEHLHIKRKAVMV